MAPEKEPSSSSQNSPSPQSLLATLATLAFGFLFGWSFSQSRSQHSQKRDATMHDSNETEQQNKKRPPEIKIRAELHTPEHTERQRTENENRNYGLQKWLVVGTWLAFGAATIYAGITYLMWCEMQRQTGISFRQMRLDHRAWIYFEVGRATLVEGQPILMPIRFFNSGKTPVMHMHGIVFVNLLNRREEPDFVYKPGHPGYEVSPGFIAPNSSQIVSWAVLPKYLPPQEELKTMLVTRTIRQGISDGSMYIAVHGKITYDDVLGDHWLTFCTFSENARPTGTDAEKCVAYNDVDKND